MPDKASTSTKDARLEIRISQEEKELCQLAADRDDRPLSNWIRSRLVKAAREEVGEGGKGRPRKPGA